MNVWIRKTSLNDVNTNLYWYFSAISMLKDAAPGTFVVRDSNSFPGAFGLALKVATPPPSAPSSPKDPSSELVRHFLIEPTSRGVRLKGCANEPVFSSLSALVYQHSLMAMALPCQLLLPEPEAAARALDSPGTNSTQQLLAQGAGNSLRKRNIRLMWNLQHMENINQRILIVQ